MESADQLLAQSFRAPPVERITLLAPGLIRVRDNNPSALTLDGTNTYVVDLGDGVVVIDPGSDDPEHLADVLAVADGLGGGVAAILTSHSHDDHTDGVRGLVERTGAEHFEAASVAGGGHVGPTRVGRGADGDSPEYAQPLVRRRVPGWLEVSDGSLATAFEIMPGLLALPTPGHTADSVTYVDLARAAAMTGDFILGRGTTVIAHPDGAVADYLESLRTLEAVFEGDRGMRLLPGHGPEVPEPLRWVRAYRDHRLSRLAEVESALARFGRDVDAIVAEIYGNISPALVAAARMSVLAQLDYFD